VNRRTCSLFVGRLACPLRVDPRRGICRREEADEQGLAINFLQPILNFGEEIFGDVVCKYDLAVGFIVGHGGGKGGRSGPKEEGQK
jgi:hypothetical protein